MISKDEARAFFVKKVFNAYPPILACGGRITRISSDFYEIDAEIPLSFRNRNLVGTLFGGAMYAVADPIYMLMLIQILGPGYVVWDKSATIKFIRPCKTGARMKFRVTPYDVETIKAELEKKKSVERVFKAELTDAECKTCATVEKLLFVAKKDEKRKQSIRSIFRFFFKE